jgi:cleavage and polyadenylation specificity factor subunit 1
MQLAQIVPMFDEETGEDGPAIVKANILDPYVVVLRVDGSVVVYKLDKSMELAEEERDGIKVSSSRTCLDLGSADFC